MDFLKFRGGILDPAHFVVAKSEIEPGCNEGRRLLQSDLVFGDSLFKPAQAGQRGAQVGMDSRCLGMHLQKLPVLRSRTFKIAGSLLLLRVLHQFLRLSEHAQQEAGVKSKNKGELPT